jgi:dTDP-glucose pyrophosphorylase
MMKIYLDRCVSEELMVSGEYYVSMSYEPMINDGKSVCVYELEHFMQWGTPADLKEYQYWSNLFASMTYPQDRPVQDGYILMPIAGHGTRFKDRGFNTPKPLIPVSGNAMAVAALNSLPNAAQERFVLRADLAELDQLKSAITRAAVKPSFVVLDESTDGQATTCMLGAEDLDPSSTVTIGACDNGLIYKVKELELLMADESVDVIIWTARGYPGAERHPYMYGWVQVDEDNLTVKSISVKKPLEDPAQDPIVVGTFTFRRYADFTESVARMKSRLGKVNGEYYVDTAINDAIALGKKCVVFDVDYYLCWGTPDDLDTYKYWESCFHKWNSHPFQKSQHNN